ncbi:hypothetical protein LIER_17509 [Lithospermum erythrorhizon]|uniref:Endonuclease/exonuclease/phosphatase domain-containing protein n=1 Tax=Lithospermum erythrorhizon TaxID=34254 RepID=A0AAV3QC73_LITER
MDSKILCWNLRGLGNKPTSMRLKNLMRTHKLDLLVLQKPMISSDKKILWNGLRSQVDAERPWVVMGDFNTITTHSEQLGRKTFVSGSMEEFVECILDYRLEDLGFVGLTFTLSNGRVA